MRLLKEELAKIWQPRIVTAIAAFGVLFYLMFSAFWVQQFHNGPFHKADFDLSAGWMEKFGATIDEDERPLLDEQLARERERFDAQVADIPEAMAAGIDKYVDLLALRDLTFDEHGRAQTDGALASLTAEEASDLRTSVFPIIVDKTNYPVIQQLEQFIAYYDSYADSEGSLSSEVLVYFTDAERARIAALDHEAESGTGYLPIGVFESTVAYAKWLAVWTALSVIVLLSPTAVRDRIHRTRALLWSSRTGRRTDRVQLFAGLLSAAILTCLNLAAYTIPFLANRPLALADAPLYSPVRIIASFPWFDFTYGEYLLVLAALVLVLGMGAGAFALALSRISDTYVSVLLKTLPLFVALGALFGSWLFETPLFFKELIGGSDIWLPKGGDVASAVVVLVAGLALCVAVYNRGSKRELLR